MLPYQFDKYFDQPVELYAAAALDLCDDCAS
jgi:hypothetical protein